MTGKKFKSVGVNATADYTLIKCIACGEVCEEAQVAEDNIVYNCGNGHHFSVMTGDTAPRIKLNKMIATLEDKNKALADYLANLEILNSEQAEMIALLKNSNGLYEQIKKNILMNIEKAVGDLYHKSGMGGAMTALEILRETLSIYKESE
jgi:hypothetical protein